jgi:hypothetical protein
MLTSSTLFVFSLLRQAVSVAEGRVPAIGTRGGTRWHNGGVVHDDL